MSMGGPGMPGMPGFPPGIPNPFEPPGAKRPRTDSGIPGFPGSNMPYDAGLGAGLMNQIPGPSGMPFPGLPISTIASLPPALQNPIQTQQQQINNATNTQNLTQQNNNSQVQQQQQQPNNSNNPQNTQNLTQNNTSPTQNKTNNNPVPSDAQIQAQRNVQEAHKQATGAPGSTVVDNEKKL